MSLYCLPLIRGRLPGLRPSEQKVARFIMGNPEDVVNMSSVELGSAAGVSESTVIKCSQRLGFEGFVQLKLALARDLAVAPTTAFGEVEQGDAPDIVIQKIFNANSAALSDTSKVLDPEQLGEAAALVSQARSVSLFGMGASGIVALDAKQKLIRIGVLAECELDPHLQLTRVSLLGPTDVVVGISYSGETIDTLEVLRLAKEVGARTICITNHPGSSAAQRSDVVLVASAAESSLRGGALASRIAQLSVVDCLFVLVAISRYEDAMTCLVKTKRAVAARKGGS
ncbi:MAG TPA: RpiR family transcriptional regulator [Firmicutes bacterium]|jgi:DNA-binding MurR/RpiR family transcriptional regulator|nr:RpiR family transcriptional regulator [Bacillota bacterium]HBK60866.1 RpiR family transcriptional regulator [Bacillota bacterium]